MSFASNGIVFLAASVVTASTPALAAPAPEFGPNPAVGWVLISNGFLPPDSGAGPIRQDPAHPYVGNDEFRRTGRQPTMPFADLSNTILQPWTRNELQKRNELALAGKAPTLGIDCGPTGGAAFLVRTNVQPYFFVQAPDKVLIFIQDDLQFRQIYLTGGHSRNLKPSWSGESIGHYEGDELVVDTIGIAGKAPVDKFFTPHTDQIHLIERFPAGVWGRQAGGARACRRPGRFHGSVERQASLPARGTWTCGTCLPAGRQFGCDGGWSAPGKKLCRKSVFLFRKRRPIGFARRQARFLIPTRRTSRGRGWVYVIWWCAMGAAMIRSLIAR
jgi:hypothetical protein